MKIQNLAIIFLVIAIPFIAILSYYIHLQQETLELQAEYDIKLSSATKEGIRAFEINTVDWTEWQGSKNFQTEKRNVRAIVNAFTTSLANNLNLSGTAREYMQNYIPAMAITMYDSYYIYAPAYVPVTAENRNGIQLYASPDGTNKATTSENDNILYVAKNGGSKYTYDETDPDTGAIIPGPQENLTTNISNAEMVYKHTLTNPIAYSANYKRGTDKFIVNYTLDNQISVFGTIGTETIQKKGYLAYFDDSTVLPRIHIDGYNKNGTNYKAENIKVDTNFHEIKFGETYINTEKLTEQIVYKWDDGVTYSLETFQYVYDIEHNKWYYDIGRDNFFTLNSAKERQWAQNSTMGAMDCKYKSISVLWGKNDDGTLEYKKIYQVLSPGKDRGKWCISINKDPDNYIASGKEEIDTEIKNEKLLELGLYEPEYSITRDFSAISYYVEAYAFTNWADHNIKGNLQQQLVNEDSSIGWTSVGNIFNIFHNDKNDPEDSTSLFVTHKKEVMKNNMIQSLNLSISNYNRNGEVGGSYGFKMPVLTDMDWDQAFSNISLITFFQGVSIGLKKYNNYAVATSNANREYVSPSELYFSFAEDDEGTGGSDANYHRVNCTKCGNYKYTGYRSVEYVLTEYDNKNLENYFKKHYYLHDNSNDTNSETACYYCIVNKSNYSQIVQDTPEKKETAYKQAKAYNEALARERYYQFQNIDGTVGIKVRYFPNLVVGEVITGIYDIPEDQLVDIGVPTQISDMVPSATTNTPYIIYKFIEWQDAEGNVYEPGKEYAFYKDTDLYAQWRIPLNNLPWKRDFIFGGSLNYNSGWSEAYGMSEEEFEHEYRSGRFNRSLNFNSRWLDKPDNEWGVITGRNHVSFVNIYDNGTTEEVQMIGNNNSPGKGAIWTELQSEYLEINSYEFDYDLNIGHSFEGVGLMLNIVDSNPENEHVGTLKGYMLTINVNYELYDLAGKSSGAIFRFTYNKGDCHNKFTASDVQLVKQFDIGSVGERGVDNKGHIKVQKTTDGYLITYKATSQDVVKEGEVSFTLDSGDTLNSNSFGFFSQHFGSEHGHSCTSIGRFVFTNMTVTAKLKEGINVSSAGGTSGS